MAMTVKETFQPLSKCQLMCPFVRDKTHYPEEVYVTPVLLLLSLHFEGRLGDGCRKAFYSDDCKIFMGTWSTEHTDMPGSHRPAGGKNTKDRS